MKIVDTRFYQLQDALEEGNLEKTKFFLEQGMDVDPYQDGRLLDLVLDLPGDLALHMMYVLIRDEALFPYLDVMFEKSLYRDRYDLAIYLAEAGAYVDVNKMLAFAVFQGNYDLATFMLELGADPNAEVKDLPVLHYTRDAEMTRILREAGATTQHPVFRQKRTNPFIYAEKKDRARVMYEMSMQSSLLPAEMMLPVLASATGFGERTALDLPRKRRF